MLHLGASVGYWRGDIKGLTDDIAALRPTLFAGVPRVFDRIYAGVMAKLEESFIKKFLFNWGYSRKLHAISNGIPQDQVNALPRHGDFNFFFTNVYNHIMSSHFSSVTNREKKTVCCIPSLACMCWVVSICLVVDPAIDGSMEYDIDQWFHMPPSPFV